MCVKMRFSRKVGVLTDYSKTLENALFSRVFLFCVTKRVTNFEYFSGGTPFYLFLVEVHGSLNVKMIKKENGYGEFKRSFKIVVLFWCSMYKNVVVERA